jgi:hypothetical protein
MEGWREKDIERERDRKADRRRGLETRKECCDFTLSGVFVRDVYSSLTSLHLAMPV